MRPCLSLLVLVFVRLFPPSSKRHRKAVPRSLTVTSVGEERAAWAEEPKSVLREPARPAWTEDPKSVLRRPERPT